MILSVGTTSYFEASFCETGESQIYLSRDAVQHREKDVPLYTHCIACDTSPSNSSLDRITPDAHAGWVTLFNVLVQPHGSPKVGSNGMIGIDYACRE